MTYEVNKKLCRSCIYRARKDAFEVYHCEYALATGKCRLDPPGICTHFEQDKSYSSREVQRAREIKLAKLKKYRDEHKVKSTRPVGRPKKEW